MIIAGIDEAGYGPLLGPLVVGCCTFEIGPAGPAAGNRTAAGNSDELPCLWKRLRKLVSKSRTKGRGGAGKKLHINDSKIVYAHPQGLKELERAVLTLLACGEAECVEGPEGLEHFLARVAPHAIEELLSYPWYQPFDGERFPLEQDFLSIRLLAGALRAEMTRGGVRCLHLAARIVPERQLNKLINSTHNKASALFGTTAIHLDHLLRTYGQRDPRPRRGAGAGAGAGGGGLTIFCDRQGGRAHYGSLLRLMFGEEGWGLEIVSEQEMRAEYRLVKAGDEVRLIFCEKAESQCLAVAVASMLCKYTREALMARFNAFWKRHLPSVEPTAGYYADGQRFLGDIHGKRLELGIPDELLIRCR